MAGLFDGVGSLLSETFGAPVTLRRAGKTDLELHAIFREIPVEVRDGDGRVVLELDPVLRVPYPNSSLISVGDKILPGNGKTYRVLAGQPSGSPGGDRLTAFHLEEI